MTTPPLPAPVPQLDFPATEGLRQDMVTQYRAMLVDMQAAIDRILEPAAVAKSYMAAVDDKQATRRDRLERYLQRYGVAQSAFVSGGQYFNTSDNALRDVALALRAERRKVQQSPQDLS